MPISSRTARTSWVNLCSCWAPAAPGITPCATSCRSPSANCAIRWARRSTSAAISTARSRSRTTPTDRWLPRSTSGPNSAAPPTPARWANACWHSSTTMAGKTTSRATRPPGSPPGRSPTRRSSSTSSTASRPPSRCSTSRSTPSARSARPYRSPPDPRSAASPCPCPWSTPTVCARPPTPSTAGPLPYCSRWRSARSAGRPVRAWS